MSTNDDPRSVPPLGGDGAASASRATIDISNDDGIAVGGASRDTIDIPSDDGIAVGGEHYLPV